MAGNRKYRVRSTAFATFCYNVFSKATEKQIASLDDFERKKFKNDKTLRQFCQHDTHEKLMTVLIKFGIEMFTAFAPTKNILDDALFLAFEQYDYPEKRVHLTESMAKENIFVLSSADLVMQMYMLSHNCLSKNYGINEYTKKLVKEYGNTPIQSNDKALQLSSDAYLKFADLVIQSFNGKNYAQETLSLDIEQLQILMVLFKNKARTLHPREIAEHMNMPGKNRYIDKRLQVMAGMELVSETSKEKNRRYCIRTKGVDYAMMFFNEVLKNSNIIK